MMSQPDLNLLVTLDALLSEGSVVRAAERLKLSPSAMSRALARLRETTGDPLLVRAGRGLVPTPRALALRQTIGPLVQEALSALQPQAHLDLATLERTFTLRTSDGFVANFGARLMNRVREQAPGVRLRFMNKLDKKSDGLREGRVDLETGIVVPATSPELRVQTLFKDRWVGVVAQGHPLSQGTITAKRYADGDHVLVSRRGLSRGLVDDALEARGLSRRVVAMVGDFSQSLVLVRGSDLITAVPERHTGHLREGLFTFDLPVKLAALSVCLMWHPRADADPAHRWLRQCVRNVCSDVDG